MSKYDLSIILPGIRNHNWEKLFISAERSIEPYSFQFIAIGPKEPPVELMGKPNFTFIKDLGSPTRCVQIGSTLAEGQNLCWVSDDGAYIPGSLSRCLAEFYKHSTKDAMCLRYIEGENGNNFPPDYWRAHHHADQRLGGIPSHYITAPLGLYNTKHFRDMGGFDCRYEHINFSTHDLAFRIQNNGGKIILSPDVVAKFYWSWITEDAKPVQEAYFQNDLPKYKDQWSQNQSERIKIDYWNWQEVESTWRRFK